MSRLLYNIVQSKEVGVAKPKALVVGGTSGMGRAMAHNLVERGYHVTVTGRTFKDEDRPNIDFFKLSIAGDYRVVAPKLDHLAGMARWDILVYAVGFYQDGRITDLTDIEIIRMMNVGMTIPILLIKRILDRQGSLERLVVISSTSQDTVRVREPVYCATKKGLAMFVHCLYPDKRIRSIMLAVPPGTKSEFWRDSENELKDYLEPEWVASEVFRFHFGDNAHFTELHLRKGDAEKGLEPESERKYNYH